MQKRIEWVDFSKGIAILLVIIGHTIGNPIIRGVIFSIHMPLFFIVSGYTNRCSENMIDYRNRLKTAALHLLVPAYCIYFIRLLLYIFINQKSYPLPDVLFTPLFASGVEVKIGNMIVPAFGMMWFLVVLFGVRILYEFLAMKCKGMKLTILCIIVSLFGMVIGQIQFLPLNFDLIMATLIFFHIGQILKSYKFYKAKAMAYFIAAITWIIGLAICGLLLHDYLELAARSYPLYPLSYLTAIAGCMLIFLIGTWIERIRVCKRIFALFCFFGKNSMVLYTIHAFDTVPYQFVQNKMPTILLVILRTTVDIAVMYSYICIRRYIKTKKLEG